MILILGNGSITLNNSSMTNTTNSLITADLLTLNAVNSIGSETLRINTNINTLTINNAVSDIYLNESNALEIGGLTTTAVVDLVVGGTLTQSENLVLTSNSNFAVDAIGDIILTGQNLLSGAIKFI